MNSLLNDEQRSIYELNADGKAFIADVLASKNIVYLTSNGKNTAVLLDIEKYDALIHEIELLRDIDEGIRQYHNGNYVTHENAIREILSQ